jgi:hypothetical protein
MANTFGDVFLDMLKTHPFTSVPITFAAQTGYGFEFVRGATAQGFVGDMAAVIEETSVLVKYGDFTSLQQDSAITVDGTTYQIRRVENADDAHTIRLVLADA